MVRQVDHMVRLVDDLMEVSRITRGKIELQLGLVTLDRVIQEAVELSRPLLDAGRHRLEVRSRVREPLTVMGDRVRLAQVFANLLNNAAKYTPEGGHIQLKLEADGDSHVLTVADDGIGMEPALVGRVFDLFTQAERTPDRSQGGLGLGLALARSLVELHGGSVAAASPGLGKGSTFTVRLPRFEQEIESPVAEAVRHAATAQAPLRVLVVDDNLDAAHTLNLFLAAAGHRVEIAYNALDALDIAKVFSPQVCLLDIGLPDLDGNELARRLRRLPQTAGATLIAATGYGRQQDRDAAHEAGFDHYMVKPVNTLQLSELLVSASATPGVR
jgi:CheY-like chemotaxis protein